MANRKFITMILGLADKRALKRIAALLALVMAIESGAVPLAQAAVIGQSMPMRSHIGAELPTATNGIQKPSVTAVAPFRVPASIGATVETYAPVSAGRLVYHVQDVHGNLGAQTNLSEIVSRLAAYADAQGKQLIVAVEGGAGKIETDTLSSFPDENVKREVSSALLRSGFLMGEEYAAIVSKPGRVKIIGIESPALYNANVAARERSVEGRESVLATVRQIKSQLVRLEGHNFNSALLTLEKNRVAVEEGRMDMADYISFLVHTDKALVAKYAMVSRLSALHEHEKSIDFSSVEKEGRRLVEQLVRQKNDKEVEKIMSDAVALREGRMSALSYYESLLARSNNAYPALNAYVSYLRDAQKVDADALFLELQSLESEMANKLVRHPLARELYKDIRWIERQERFFSLNMVPQEWQAQKGVDVAQIYRTNGEIRSFVAEQVNALGYRFATPPFSMTDLQIAVRGATGFYQAAESRDAAMESMLRRVLDKHEKDGAIVAFVAGGFHTPGMTRELRSHGIAYQIIRPQLEAGVELNKDLDYPAFKGGARLLTDRANTDFLRAASQLTETGRPIVQRLLNDTAANKSGKASPSLRRDVAQIFSDHVPSRKSVVTYEGVSTAIGFLMGVAFSLVIVAGYLLRHVIMTAIRSMTSSKSDVDESIVTAPVVAAAEQTKTPMPVLTSEEILAAVKESVKVFGLDKPEDLSDLLYIAVQYNNLLRGDSPLKMFTHVDVPLNPSAPGAGNPVGANFQVSALQPDQTFPHIGVIDLVREVARRKAGDPQLNAKVVVNALDGGLGENYTRVLYLMQGVLDSRGVMIDPILGAKGTDLSHDVTVYRTKTNGDKVAEVRSVSDAEMKLLQLMHKKQHFAKMEFEPLVNKDSLGSYRELFKKIYLKDALDDSVTNKRTYGDVLNAMGVTVKDPHLQKDLFGVKADDHTLPTTKEGVPAQPGGHAQLGFWFFIEALKDAVVRATQSVKENPTIRVFYNGDNLNSRPNEDLVQNMLDKKHVSYMVATPAEPNDKKGGKIGIRWYQVDGEWVPVPDMMEMAQAKSAKQLEEFYGAGQIDGLGVPHRQLFNTNQLYINQDLLGDILLDLRNLITSRLQGTPVYEQSTDKELLVNYELAKIFGPTLIPKDAKAGYFPIDGAIGSVLLNLNAYFLLNKRDAAVSEILAKRNIERILHIVDGPRMEAFTPEKTPADRIVEDGRFRILSTDPDFDKNEWVFEDRNPGKPMPDVEVFGKVDGKSTANWKNDAGLWADIGTIRSLLPKLDIAEAKYLGIYGTPFKAPAGATFVGEVRVTNHATPVGVRFTDLTTPAYRAALATVSPDHVQVIPADNAAGFTVKLTDVHLIIRADGTLQAVPFGQNPVTQPFSVSGSVLASIGYAILGVALGYALHPYAGAFALIGLIYAVIASTAAIAVRADASVPAGTDLAGLEATGRFDSRAIATVRDFAARLSSDKRPVSVKLTNGAAADVDTKAGVLTIGTSLLAKSSGLSGVARRLLLLAVLGHERIHLVSALQIPTKSKGFFWVVNEFIAWSLGIFVFFGLVVFSSRSSSDTEGKTFEDRSIMSSAARVGHIGDAIYNGAVKLAEQYRSKLLKREAPSNILIPIASIPGFDKTDDASFVGLLQSFHLPATNSEGVNSEVVFGYPVDASAADVDRLTRLVASANSSPSKAAGINYTLQALPASIVNISSLFSAGRNVTAANTIVLGGETARPLINGASFQPVIGMPQLAVATYVYSHYSNGHEVYDALVALLKDLPAFQEISLSQQISADILAAIQA